MIPRNTNSNVSWMLDQYRNSSQDPSNPIFFLSSSKSENLEIRLTVDNRIIKIPEPTLTVLDLILPVNFKPEINNIEKIVAVYSIQLIISVISPPYSK